MGGVAGRSRLKRGVFCSVAEMQAAINRFLARTNAGPKRFVWTADHERVIEKVQQENKALDHIL